MRKEIDARGLACPQPVILAKKALGEEKLQSLTIIVDNPIARENLAKLAKSLGYGFNIREKAGDYFLEIQKDSAMVNASAAEDPGAPGEGPAPAPGETVFLITGETFGQGSEELGRVLQRMFFYTLTESQPKPATLVFLNGGVKTVLKGTETAPLLENLAASGVEILVCGTCLDYFRVSQELGVGEISNMYTITERLLQAGKVVTIP